jgi:hypothetical protein
MLTLKLTGDYFFVNQLESLQRTELSNEVYIAEKQPIILLLRPRKLSHESVDCNRRHKRKNLKGRQEMKNSRARDRFPSHVSFQKICLE